MQAAKIRGLGRLLYLITCLFFCLQASAKDHIYYSADGRNPAGTSKSTSKIHTTPHGACTELMGAFGYASFTVGSGTKTGFCSTTINGQLWHIGTWRQHTVSCADGQVLDDAGKCDAPPLPCSQQPPIYSAQSCTYIESLKVFSCPTSLTYQGCEYVSAGGNNCDLATGICTGKWAPTGDNASPDGENCTDTTCAPVPSPNPNPNPDPDPGTGGGSTDFDMCLTGTDGKTYCINDPDTGCGTYNGATGCPQPDKNCRSHNGEWICSDPNKDNRNCSYVKGEQVCINPKNPTQTIPTDSPDHPKNGGNADGNPNNDPTAPGTPTGTTAPSNPQSSNSAATNETVRDVGDSLGGKIDKTNGLLGSILGAVEGIRGAMSGDGNSDDGGDGDGECKDETEGCSSGEDGSGEGEGTDLAALIGDKGDELLADREKESQDLLDSLPQQVEDLFGSDGSGVGLGSSTLENLFPSHAACSDFRIPLNFAGKSFYLEIPACELSRVKPLLEWLIWCITLIGLWNIFYTGLRQDNAKAVKGGF